MTAHISSEVAESEEVLDFWFGDTLTGPEAIEQRQRIWFKGGAAFDRECIERFSSHHCAAAGGELDYWAQSPRGRLALIILLDQLSRNIFRGSADAFGQDRRALTLCREGIELGHDRHLSPIERTFFYMPMEHAEDRDVQALSVQHFEALAEGATGKMRELLLANAEYARQHRDIIERFGRFPHRNAVLGRESTADEVAYLAEDAPRFGQ